MFETLFLWLQDWEPITLPRICGEWEPTEFTVLKTGGMCESNTMDNESAYGWDTLIAA